MQTEAAKRNKAYAKYIGKLFRFAPNAYLDVPRTQLFIVTDVTLDVSGDSLFHYQLTTTGAQLQAWASLLDIVEWVTPENH